MTLPLPSLDRATLTALNARCRPDEALRPDDPRFVDLDATPDDDAPGPRGDRWTDPMRDALRLAGAESISALVSGTRGCGKSTDLLNLADQLRSDGHLVVFIDSDPRLDRSAEPHLADLLLLMLCDAERAVLREYAPVAADETPSALFGGLWRSLCSIALPPAADSGYVDVRPSMLNAPRTAVIGEFKTSTWLRRNIRDAFDHRRTAILDAIRGAFTELCERVRREGKVSLVLIVDSLEHLQPTSGDAEKVFASAERLFAGREIELPAHTIYTVPIAVFLRLRRPISFVPVVKIAERSARHTAGYDVLRALVRARLDASHLTSLLGADALSERIDGVIRASGGHVRTLVSLLQELVKAAKEGVAPAVSASAVGRVLQRSEGKLAANVESEGDDARALLRRVAETGRLPTPDETQWPRLALLLDLNALLYHGGDTPWSVHPALLLAARPEDHRLTRVELTDVGPIRTLSLDLRPGWNLLVGDNSSGKTSVLRAVALALAGTDPRASVASARVLRVGALRGTVSVSIDRNTFTTTLERGLSGVTAKASRDTLTQLGRWLTLGFPAVRGVVTRAISGPAAAQPDAPGVWDVLPLVEGANDARLDDTRQWIVNTAIRSEGADNPERYQRLLARWFEIVAELMPGLDFKYARVDRQTWQVFVSTADGDLPIDQLSQGMVATLGWIGTVLRRLYEVFPESEAPEREPVLVLIDELDSHLHPAWQREVIPLVRNQFPNAQVIATTHSPLLVNALDDPERDAIFRCSRDAAGALSVTRITQDLRGHRADQVLTSPAFELETSRSVYAAALRKRHLEVLARRHESAEANALASALTAEVRALIPSPPETPEARESAAEAERRADATLKARIAQSSVEELQNLREVLLSIQGGRS